MTDRMIDEATVPVEVGIIAIHKIEISASGKVIYAVGTGLPVATEATVDRPCKCVTGEDTNDDTCAESKDPVIGDALFILSNRHNGWQDYNLRGNKKWEEYRDKNDHCEAKAE